MARTSSCENSKSAAVREPLAAQYKTRHKTIVKHRHQVVVGSSTSRQTCKGTSQRKHTQAATQAQPGNHLTQRHAHHRHPRRQPGPGPDRHSTAPADRRLKDASALLGPPAGLQPATTQARPLCRGPARSSIQESGNPAAALSSTPSISAMARTSSCENSKKGQRLGSPSQHNTKQGIRLL